VSFIMPFLTGRYTRFDVFTAVKMSMFVFRVDFLEETDVSEVHTSSGLQQHRQFSLFAIFLTSEFQRLFYWGKNGRSVKITPLHHSLEVKNSWSLLPRLLTLARCLNTGTIFTFTVTNVTVVVPKFCSYVRSVTARLCYVPCGRVVVLLCYDCV
jgi:hypothetical protein